MRVEELADLPLAQSDVFGQAVRVRHLHFAPEKGLGILDGGESGSVVTFNQGETSAAKLIGFKITQFCYIFSTTIIVLTPCFNQVIYFLKIKGI